MWDRCPALVGPDLLKSKGGEFAQTLVKYSVVGIPTTVAECAGAAESIQQTIEASGLDQCELVHLQVCCPMPPRARSYPHLMIVAGCSPRDLVPGMQNRPARHIGRHDSVVRNADRHHNATRHRHRNIKHGSHRSEQGTTCLLPWTDATRGAASVKGTRARGRVAQST